MRIEDLSEYYQQQYEGLRHSFYTIETEIGQALDEANSLEDFQNEVESRMLELVNEALGQISVFTEKNYILQEEA